jgi:EmrB/QacA subfamily drug resistance transporter
MELTRQQKVFTFVGTLLGLFLGALDQTVVATAGPTIQHDLAIPPALYVWLTTAYMLASTVFVPVWAKLSDLFGRRRIIVAGITIFLAASVACGLSQTTLQLIVCRGVQGLGSASLFTTAFAVVADMFSPAERGKYSGIFGGVFGLSSIVGPLLGGFITHRFGWHWVFFINLPVGAVALFFILTRMPPLKREHAVPPKVDFIGAVLLALAVVPILIALSMARAQVIPGWTLTSWHSLSMFGGGALMLVVFGLFERTREQPLIDLKLFRIRVFAVGNACVFVLGGVFISPMIFLPWYVTRVAGVSPEKAGLSLMPLVFGVIAGNVISGQVTSRLGRYKVPMLVGLLLLLTGLSVMSFTLHPDISLSELIAKMLLVGFGLGPAIPLYTIAIQNAIPPEVIGSATGVATFFRQMGGTLGSAIAGTVFAATLGGAAVPIGAEGPIGGQAPVNDEAMKLAFTLALENVYRFTLALAVVALLLTLVLPSLPLRRSAPRGAVARAEAPGATSS